MIALLTLAWSAQFAVAGEHPPVDAKRACVTSSCHLGAGGKSAAASVHDPHAGGDCRACHDLALDAASHRLRGAPAGGDGSDRSGAWDVAVCAGCHGESLYARGARPGATGFTDGGSNLHALHVQAGRGPRCLTCHEPHEARQAWLLRERIPAPGGARIPQEFRAEPAGGWCRTGCHAPKRYRR
jgi:predicted CXXCH cytochrome family protein